MDEARAVSDLGIVIIGRNEGERLLRCLASVGGRDVAVVYVDSGSSDGSVAAARAQGAVVVQLDMAQPFTAARARNAGRRALPDTVRLVQFVDGDCAVQPGWIEAGRAALDADDGLAAVFGRRREIAPGASRYNWLCDIEWAVPPGPVWYFGGDVMLRAAAFDAAGGYPDEMIAGEEPDLSIRLRARGWRLACLPQEMTLHDAAITRFGQWRKRTTRSGHAYAELVARNGGSALQDFTRRMFGVLLWGAALPAVAFAVFAFGLVTHTKWMMALAGAVLLLPLLQLARITRREARTRPLREAATIATFLMLAKPAESLGIARYWLGRLGGRRSSIMEYKGATG